ncbi:MAG: hypothetical protein M1548_05225 [Actinobacteria bacterium]|nr:hypothetical protein [Actinomycetota bacterium]
MDRTEPSREEVKEKARERRGARGRIVKSIALIILILIVLIIPQRAQRYVWYAQSVACLSCHPQMQAKFSEKNVHNPFMLRQCTTCHRQHASVPGRERKSENRSFWGRAVERLLPGFVREDIWNLILGLPTSTKVKGVKSVLGTKNPTKPQEETCMTCHQKIARQMGRKFAHPPFNGKKCLSCHDPHASNFTSMTRRNSTELCSMCHRMDKDRARRFKHPPFAINSCASCHTGHASDYSRLLKASQKEVCFTCHKRIAPLLYMPVQHPPFENGQCTGCHLPHASDATVLLIDNMPQVCYRCHSKTESDFDRPSKHPVSSLFTCARCHRPHAGQEPSLLFGRGNEVCYRCHEKIRASFEVTKHSTLQFERGRGACLGCHAYHGSVYRPLLANEPVTTCSRCHTDKANKVMLINHPAGANYYDVRRKAQLTCTSTCHWVHYVPENALLKWKPDELCLICHAQIGITR